MTEDEKKLIQARHRLEAVQARNRVQERKERTRRLIQEGAILESVWPEVRDIPMADLHTTRHPADHPLGQTSRLDIRRSG